MRPRWPCQARIGATYLQLISALSKKRRTQRQQNVANKFWPYWPQYMSIFQMSRHGVLRGNLSPGKAETILPARYPPIMLFEESFGSCFSSISPMNSCHWTVALAPSWTSHRIRSWCRDRPWFQNVSLLILFCLDYFQIAIVDWPRMALGNASHTFTPSFGWCSLGKTTSRRSSTLQLNPIRGFPRVRQLSLRRPQQHIIASNFSITSDVQPYFLIASLCPS